MRMKVSWREQKVQWMRLRGIYVSSPGKGLGGPLVLIAGAGHQGLLEIETKRNELGE